MRKILKKVSASLILILMIFSVSFNVLTYAATMQNNGDGTVTIRSTYMQLKILESTYNKMTDDQWKTWLGKYDNYYSTLRSYTGVDPVSETGNSYITIDATSDSIGTYAYYHTYEYGRWDCTIFIRTTIFETEINKIKSNISNTDSYTLIHELGHAFQYKYDTTAANLKDWCFNAEIVTMLEAAYVQQMNGISTLYYGNLATFNDCKTAYLNQMYGMDSGYNNYYWLAGKLLTIKDSSRLSSFSSIIKSGTVSGSYSNRFNKFIDNWQDTTGEDIWSQFSDADKSTISTILGGTIGTVKNINTSVSSITLIGNNSNKSNTIDYTQEDTQATVTVVVKSDEQPQSVKIKLGDKEQTITIANKNGDTYTFTTSIDVSTTTTQQQLLRDKNYIVVVTDGNGKEKTYKKSLKVEDEEKSDGAIEIGDIGISQPNGDENGIFNSEKGDTITIQVQVDGIENEEDITKSTVKLDGFKVEDTDISIDENGQATVTITMKKTEDIELEEGETTGKVTIIANGKTITETFDIEITNEEQVEIDYSNVVVQYYDYKERKYVTIDETIKELNIEIEKNDIYSFNIRISGIEEERSGIKLNIGSTTVNLELNDNGFYKGDGISLKSAGKYNARVDLSDTIHREFTINLTVTEEEKENKNLVLYSDLTNLTFVEGWDYGKTKSNSFTNHGISGADKYFIFVDRDNPKKAYFCFDNTLHLDPSYHYILYDAEDYTTLSTKQKLILAFLAEVETFTDSNGRTWNFTNDTSDAGYDYGYSVSRYAVQQFYIWQYVKGQQANAGALATMINDIRDLKDNQNDYIDVNEGTITVNGETKKINLDTFKAIKYIPRVEKDQNNKTYREGEELQPFFTYTYETEDVPTTEIQLKKINENGEPVEATFSVAKRNENGGWTFISPNYTFTTDKETGLTDPIEVEEGEYFIYETNVKGGYKPTTQYAIVTVDEEGKCEYKIYEANANGLSNGYVKSANGTEASEELDWNSGEVEEDGEIELLLEVTNKIKKTDLELQLQKIDGSTGGPLSGVGFSINIDGLYSGSVTTGSDGKNTQPIKIEKERLQAGTYRGTITETKKPSEEYKEIDPINFTISVSEDGTVSIGGVSNNFASLSTNAIDELVTATFTIKNIKEEEEKPEEPKEGVQFPLLMSIQGKVWLDEPQGKNSEANGEYDSGDKILQGITVKLYEADGVTEAKFADKNRVKELLNENSKYLTEDLLAKLQRRADNISENYETKTDKNGSFYFGGLDPDKLYTLKFEYNGMRYSEIMASIEVEGCGTPKSVQTTAKAVEDSARRSEITEMFKEIGPYPNNYSGGLVFTQTEVENYEKKGELPDGVSASQMEKFLEDTKITAKIEGIGKILEEAESVLLAHNSGLYPGINSGFKFPVVKSEQSSRIYYIYGEEAVQQWIDSLKILENSENVGYKIQAYEFYDKYTTEYNSYSEGNSHWHTEDTKTDYNVRYDALYKSYIKDIENSGSVYVPNQSAGTCGWKPSRPSNLPPTYNWNPSSCQGKKGIEISHSARHDEDSYWDCTRYYVDEGYSTGVEQGGNYWTRIATFDMENEPLFDDDGTSGKSGIEDGKWGWIGLTNIDDNKITTPQGKEGLGKLYNMLVEKIDSLSPSEEDLCLVYRPTVDLGLYDNVQKAVVTINKQTETYVYDKRAANGGIFKFGVNEYDIINSNNNPKNIKQVEQAYANYYDSLSNGNPDSGENAIAERKYEDIGIRKEDININMEGNGSITTNGTAIAGGYNDYDVSIEMTYRIKIYNQSAVSARVTNILDYYLDTFTFDGAYSDAECTQKIADGTPATGEVKPQGYNVMNIELSSQELKGNDSYEIFVKLHMTDPKGTLGAEGVLDAGYKTFNYAEINGYGTNIGVIDIDSSPGDLVPEKRFEEGPYDDDEGKSPTLIFKNPENASRKMSGVVFEDVDTGKIGAVQSYAGQTRNVDGIYISGSDKPVAGAIVELVEVNESGSPVSSGNEPVSIVTNKKEPGVRAQTLTKEDGTFEFNEIVASNYILRYNYGNNYETVLTKRNQVSGVNLLNEKSYNGETYENTTPIRSAGDVYWYTNTTNGKSYAMDNNDRRKIVTNNFVDLTNEKAEILNSWKDRQPVMQLVDQLIERASMFAETEKMLLDVEYHKEYPNKIVETKDDGYYGKTYVMDNLNFGIKERERAELQITKKVTKISLVDSSGRPITEGTLDDLIEGKMKYVKWLQNEEDTKGFVDMEIDQELLSGATLKITYEMAVTNTSETSSEQPNTIRNIQLIDYVSNNLNYDISYGNNSVQGWNPVTVQNLMNSGLLNKTSLETDDDSNRIDLLSYQTILTTTIDSLSAGETKKKELTLEKNLSAQEESDFNYENQVEIVRSENQKGRGDYSSIYGNLDPETYTSRKGNLNWETIDIKDKNGYPQQVTITADGVTGVENSNPAIRMAEKDSGNAEEVIITPPTGAKGIVLQTYHYVLALIALITTAIGITIIKKHIKI